MRDEKVYNKRPTGRPSRGSAINGTAIRQFVLSNVESHPRDLPKLVAQRFVITRQAAHKHIRKLVDENSLTQEGNTRNRSYKLALLVDYYRTFPITPVLAEDRVWSQEISPALGDLPPNVLDIWNFCFTEMFNNAIDHSAGTEICVWLKKTAVKTQIMVTDDGIGIFRKIQQSLGLLDERHAILELSKGKLTTDPEKHSGQGIFFTSRLLDYFAIHSGGSAFSHRIDAPSKWLADWMMELDHEYQGTAVIMILSNESTTTCKAVFDQYSSGSDYGFTKTVVPVRLAQYGEDKLVSRSQAKRLVARIEKFKSVVFDFEGVQTIGQAFADEIFRVFARAHPEIEIVPITTTPQVLGMINAAQQG